MSTLLQDLRQAARALRRSPGFTLVALLTLGLGTGAATAVFAVVDAALLAPLPYPRGERLVRIYERDVKENRPFGRVSVADFRDWRSGASRFSGLALTRFSTATLTGPGDAERLSALRVSASFFEVLEVAPALGRGFRAEDEREGAPRVAVISHGIWQRSFGGAADVIGRSVALSGAPTTIVGVLAAGFRSPLGSEHDVYLPDAFESLAADPARARRMHAFSAIGRLAEGSSLEAGRDQLLAIGRRLEAEHPEANTGHEPNPVPLRDALARNAAPLLRAVSAAVLLLLALAGLNVAGLALARGLARQHDFALRAALGASRSRILRQQLAESLLLGGLGGLLGALFATWGASALAAFAGPLAPAGAPLSGRVFAFAAGASALAAALCGLAPAVAAARLDLVSIVKGGMQGATPPAARLRLRSAFVGLQVGLACVLLVGCGLMLRSVLLLAEVKPGFTPEGVLSFRTALPASRYADPRARAALQDAFAERLRALPGVDAVAFGYTLPFYDLSTTSVIVEGRPVEAGPAPEAGYNSVSPDYFRALGIPLQRGRAIEPSDTADSPPVVVVNQALAERFFPGEDPVGRRVLSGAETRAYEIVGVVGDVLRAGLDDAPVPEMFFALAQDTTSSPNVLVRAAPAGFASLPEAARRELRALDPELPVYDVRPLVALVATTLAPRRLLLGLLATFGAAAVLLASIGLAGVVSQLVAQRRREIGVRMALGARAGDVLGLVLRAGLAPVGVGVALGLVGAAALSRFVAALLFGVAPGDPATYAGAALTLLLAAAAACYVPARRAVSIDPTEALRSE
jgi:predicted permease